jgi:hypothetical protein
MPPERQEGKRTWSVLGRFQWSPPVLACPESLDVVWRVPGPGARAFRRPARDGHSNAKTRFQSFFMLITTQPFAVASSING